MNKNYDRGAEDLGNIVALEHVNLQVGDQALATLFYVSGLGLTRDPQQRLSVSVARHCEPSARRPRARPANGRSPSRPGIVGDLRL